MLADLLYRLRALIRRKTVEAELEGELRFHFDHQVEKGVRSGLSRVEALRRARLSFGGLDQVKDECRDARGVSALEATLHDFRYAVRMLRKSPAFTAVVVLSLALGIGANTAIFTLINAVMWRMLPVTSPEQLMLLAKTSAGSAGYDTGFTYSDFRRLREQNQVFTDLAAYSLLRINVSVNGSAEPAAEGQLVSGSYFSVLGIKPVAGRSITAQDDVLPDAHPVAMISYSYWKRRFGLDGSTVGRTISLSGRPFTIIGVTPPEFFGLEVGAAPDIFAPVMMQPTLMPAAENWLTGSINTAHWLRSFGRLKSGVDPQQAAAGMAVLFHQDSVPKPVGSKQPVQEKLILLPASTGLSALRSQFSQPLFILMAVVAIVLLIACANAANLLLARSAARRPEFAMRLALGAGRWRLMRQMLVESVLLALLGGAGGILFAYWATRLLVNFMSAGRTPILLDLQPDWRVLSFTAAVSIVTGILFGLAPAARAIRVDAAPAIKGRAGRPAQGRYALRPGKILAVVQVGLSLPLLIGAGLFVRSLQKLNSQDSGFPRESVLMVRVEPKGSDQRGVPGAAARLDRIYRDLLDRVKAIPGVSSASMAHFTPTNRIGFSTRLRLPSGEEIGVASLMTYPNYFATMGISLAAGRDFDARDLDENSPIAIVVNEAFVHQFFQNEGAIGKQVSARLGRRGWLPAEIVGVVKDSRYANLRGETPPVIYQPFLQTNTGRGQMVLHARVSGNSDAVLPRIRDAVQEIDRHTPVFDVRTLASKMDAALVRERLIATLSGFFSVLALILASVGLYGLLAFTVVQRTGEIGVRMALGAASGDVVRMVLRDALMLVLGGIAIGVPVTFAAARLASTQVSGLLFGLQVTDPATIAGATALMAMVALVAGYLPARRASRVDPLVALRNE